MKQSETLRLWICPCGLILWLRYQIALTSGVCKKKSNKIQHMPYLL